MKKILVTGGKGFIGSHLVSCLLNQGFEVLVLDKSIYKPTFCDISAAQLIEGDVLSQELLRECLANVDICFHLAAISSLPTCNRDWIFSHMNNVLAFNGLLEEIRRKKKPTKLIYASSAAVYGNYTSLPLSEDRPVSPLAVYGVDKLSNELYAKALYTLAGIPSLGLRFFNVYGPGQLKDSSYSGVISCFKQAILKNEALTIYGDGKQSRDFIYIDDVIEALLLAAKTSQDTSGIFNVCRGSFLTIQELAELMLKLSGKKLSMNYLPARRGDILHSLGDPSLAEEALSFKAKISMQTGLTRFLKEDFNY